jgi:hypothetical protein
MIENFRRGQPEIVHLFDQFGHAFKPPLPKGFCPCIYNNTRSLQNP